MMMTRVRLLVSRAGVGFTNDVGDVIEVEAAEAGRLIATGQAVAVLAPETAMNNPKAERAVKPRAKPRTRKPKAKTDE